MKQPRLILITDTAKGDDELIGSARRAFETGGPGEEVAVLLRNPAQRDIRALALQMRDLTRAFGAGLIVHTDLDLARDVDADGIHVGTAGMDVLKRAVGFGWTSVSTHSDEEVVRGRASGATALVVSPIFETPGKGEARGMDAIRLAKRLAPDMWVVALGGIDANRSVDCFRAGADAVALVRAWTERTVDIHGLLARSKSDRH